jgi:hypothetical protein
MPLVRRTLAIFLKAEFGFFGVSVLTDKHTPRLCGFDCKMGALLFFVFCFLPCLII